MGRYKVLEAIGEGSFGKVFRGECKETGQTVALKFISKHLKGDHELLSLRRECEIQRGLSHPNIVLMLDSFETERELVAVSEYVPQQLCALLQSNGCMAEPVVCSVACNLVSALYYLHSHRIVHRDIKPQNILLTASGVAKLCDFGFSKKMEINTYVLESIKGTPLYMAPELIEQQPYDHKADLWSLGCILYELLTSKPPFSTSSIVNLIEMVRSKPVQWPSGCSAVCINFLKGLLQKDQDERFEWPDMLHHPWVSAGITVMPHNPRIASLTAPLTQSQQQVKEHQKQQVARKNMGQPNLLPRAIARKMMLEARALPEVEPPFAMTPPNPVIAAPVAVEQAQKQQSSNVPSDATICSSLEKMSLSNDVTECTQTNTIDAPPKSVPGEVNRCASQNTESAVRATAFRDSDSTKKISSETDSDKRRNSNDLLSEPDDKRGESQASTKQTASSGCLLDKESVSCITNHTVSSNDTEIQEDEWCHFLNQSLADVMGGNFDVYTQPGELAMFVSPLRNSSCPVPVAEKIAYLFMLPFVTKPSEEVMSDICSSYLEHKVVCNLIFAYKHLFNKKRTESEDLDKEQVHTLSQMLSVVCHLVHLESHSAFLTQLCEGVCVLHCHAALGKSLICSSASWQLQSTILAILTQVRRHLNPTFNWETCSYQSPFVYWPIFLLYCFV